MTSSVMRRALAGALVAAAVMAAAPAHAVGPAGWQQVSTSTPGTSYPGLRNIDRPTVLRVGTGSAVVWPVQVSPSTQSYQGALLDAAGARQGVPFDVVANWSTLTERPRLLTVNGQPFLSFTGLRSTATGEPYTSGAAVYATSPDGRTWTVGPGSMSASTSAYADYGMDATGVDGTPVWAGNPGSTTGIAWHVGIAPSEPAPAGSDGFIGLVGCCAYDAALARDSATGALIGAFYSNSDAAAEQGVQVAQLLPSPGALTRAPGSVTGFGGSVRSLSPDQRIAMVSRPGGGVLAAYKSGYPTATSIRVWRVGAPAAVRIPGSAGATRVALATDPTGTVWVAWTTSTHVKLVRMKGDRVVRNSTIAWARPAKTSQLWSIAASSGAAKRLDVVITATGPGDTIQVYARQARIR